MTVCQEKWSYGTQLKATIILSVSVMLMFVSYTSVQGIATKFYESNGHQYYGRVSLILIYTLFALSTIYSSTIIKALGYKTVFIGGVFCYALLDSTALIIYFTQNEFISISVIIFTSCLCGIAAGNIWVAQNAYIGEVASKQNMSEMFGIFEGVRSISVVLGFLLTVYVFKYYDGFTFFFILIPLSLVSMALLLLLPDPPQDQSSYMRIEQSKEVGLKKIINYFKLLSIKQNFEIYSFSTVNSFTATLVSNFAYKIVDYSIKTEMGESEEEYKARLTYLFGFVLLWYGIGRCLSSFCVKKITEKLDCFQFCYYSSFSCIIAIVVGAISYYLSSLPLCCLFSFIQGIAYASTRTSCNILIKVVFKNNLDLIGISYLISSFSFVANVVLLLVLTKISMQLCFLVYLVLLIAITHQTGKISAIFKNRDDNQGTELKVREV